MTDNRYGVIIADPPWKYRNYGDAVNGAAESAMSCMETSRIANIPVYKWCREDTVLFLWGTNPKLPDALKVLAFWGFDYVTCFPWIKTSIGKPFEPRMNVGHWVRGASEIVLIGRRTKKAVRGKGGARYTAPLGLLYGEPRQFWATAQKPHSRKPYGLHELAEQEFNGPYLELFARGEREGWDTWGFDTGYRLGLHGVKKL